MSLLEKVVYVADLTSAERDFDGAKALRKLADKDLDEAIFRSQQFVLEGLVKKGVPLHPDSLACYNAFALKICPKPDVN